MAASPDREAVAGAVRGYLERRRTMTLATVDAGGPSACHLFYCSDPELNLYFVSEATTRHCRALTENPGVAVTVSEDHRDWKGIRGVQLRGFASEVAESDRPAVVERYLDKFAELREMVDDPTDPESRIVGNRLLAGTFYRIRPDWVRLIDNGRGFGFKQELKLP